MCPVTCTWLELPVRTSTLPEPVVRSMCTGPVTCKVRWNEPSAAASGRQGRKTNQSRDRKRDSGQSRREHISAFHGFSRSC